MSYEDSSCCAQLFLLPLKWVIPKKHNSLLKERWIVLPLQITLPGYRQLWGTCEGQNATLKYLFLSQVAPLMSSGLTATEVSKKTAIWSELRKGSGEYFPSADTGLGSLPQRFRSYQVLPSPFRMWCQLNLNGSYCRGWNPWPPCAPILYPVNIMQP